MPEYLVELYVPRTGAQDVHTAAGRARAAAEELTREGTPVRYLRFIFLPEDETCFHLFDGPSADAVRLASERAGLSPERIVQTAD